MRKTYRRRPERSALGVHIVNIPRINFSHATLRSGQRKVLGWKLTTFDGYENLYYLAPTL